MNDSCLLDTNIMMDILNKRQRHSVALEVLNEFSEYYISTTTFCTLFYLLRKTGRDKYDISKEIAFAKIISSSEKNCLEGLEMAKTAEDVEDCVEISIASENKLTFITADQELREVYYKKCKMKVIV